MTVALYTNIISPHQLPLAAELAKLVGYDNYTYVYSDAFHKERAAMGWNDAASVRCVKDDEPQARQVLEDCDVLICGHRALDLMERRCRRGKRTFYASERWFKPIPIPLVSRAFNVYLTGRVRLLHPDYMRMVRRFVALANGSPCFCLLPYGVHALRDFSRMGIPKGKLTLWGYFVTPSSGAGNRPKCGFSDGRRLRILWVGRMMALKNVDTVLRAVRNLVCRGCPVELTVVGDGAECHRLLALARGLPVVFKPSVPIADVRTIMHEHDVYVFPSNGMDGWGAVVSEALEEGMVVFGSEEAGATATLLPPKCRFHCRDYRRLASLLRDVVERPQDNLPIGIGDWSAKRGAERFLELCK